MPTKTFKYRVWLVYDHDEDKNQLIAYDCTAVTPRVAMNKAMSTFESTHWRLRHTLRGARAIRATEL